MPGIAPEWNADEDEQDSALDPALAAEAVAHARKALQNSGYQPQTAEEIALHAKLNANR
jgi:hypothetical protein